MKSWELNVRASSVCVNEPLTPRVLQQALASAIVGSTGHLVTLAPYEFCALPLTRGKGMHARGASRFLQLAPGEEESQSNWGTLRVASTMEQLPEVRPQALLEPNRGAHAGLWWAAGRLHASSQPYRCSKLKLESQLNRTWAANLLRSVETTISRGQSLECWPAFVSIGRKAGQSVDVV